MVYKITIIDTNSKQQQIENKKRMQVNFSENRVEHLKLRDNSD